MRLRARYDEMPADLIFAARLNDTFARGRSILELTYRRNAPLMDRTVMRITGIASTLIFIVLVGSLFIAHAAQAATGAFRLRTVADIPLHGRATRFDY